MQAAKNSILRQIECKLLNRNTPILVALDGPSGSGKSTVASLVAESSGAALIQSDDFFAAEIPATEWDSRSPAAKASDSIDWRRLRREALEPLLAGHAAKWHAFDFTSGVLPAGAYAFRTDFVECKPAAVVVLDGAYSTRPELAGLVDLSVLIDAPLEVRRARLQRREEKSFLAEWHARWDEAERYYFTLVRPKSSFDLVCELSAHNPLVTG